MKIVITGGGGFIGFKLAKALLVSDFSRKGYIDGRSLRPPKHSAAMTEAVGSFFK